MYVKTRLHDSLSKRQLLPLTFLLLSIANQAIGQETLWTLKGMERLDHLGISVAPISDLTGDGLPDLIVGANLAGSRPVSAGKVYLVSGVDGVIHRTQNGGERWQLGTKVANVGDVDADGFPDYMATAPGGRTITTSRALVLSGSDGSIEFSFSGEKDDGYAANVSGAGDVDGDGHDDFLIAATQKDSRRGVVTLHSGRTGLSLAEFTGEKDNDELGTSMAPLGDVNADGFADFLLGAPQERFGALPGYVHAISGIDMSVLYRLEIGQPADLFGRFSANVQDLDGDGFDEFAVASGPLRLTNIYEARDGTLLYSIPGPVSGVSGSGDVNGDSTPDILVGWTRTSLSVYSGVDGGILYRRYADAFDGDSTMWATSFAGAGDVDGDGLHDFVIGDYMKDDSNLRDAGEITLHTGNDLFLHRSPRDVSPGDVIDLVTAGGRPGAAFALVLEEVNGVSTFLPVVVSQLDAAGRFTLGGLIPPGAPISLVASFRSYAADQHLAASALETVEIQ